MYLRGLGSLSDDLAAAITRMEGACSPSGCRNNNPGNLRGGSGATAVDSRGIAIFPDLATGQAALDHQIALNMSRGLTLQEFFTGKQGVYAGYDKTNPAYAQTVAGWIGIDPNAPLGSSAPMPAVPADPSGVDTGYSDSFSLVEPDGSLSGTAWLAIGLATLGLVYAAA